MFIEQTQLRGNREEPIQTTAESYYELLVA